MLISSLRKRNRVSNVELKRTVKKTVVIGTLASPLCLAKYIRRHID